MNAIDFDEYFPLALGLFQKHPYAAEGHIQHYKYVLVDEFQDISTSQMTLLTHLAPVSRPWITVCGDRNQVRPCPTSLKQFLGPSQSNDERACISTPPPRDAPLTPSLSNPNLDPVNLRLRWGLQGGQL